MGGDLEFWRSLFAQGGATAIALLMFVAYRKDIKGTADVLIQVVRENTTANTELIALVRALHQRLDVEAHARNPRRDAH